MHIRKVAVDEQSFRGGRVAVSGLRLHEEAVLGAGDVSAGLIVRGNNPFRGDDLPDQRAGGAVPLNCGDGSERVAAAVSDAESEDVIAFHGIGRVFGVVIGHFSSVDGHRAGLASHKVRVRVQGKDRVGVGHRSSVRP